ncbi:MAG: insulinase family protein [Myxococcales bacterium]|nr:insulinase family protein [Myxococcales bacterium]
MKYLSQNHPRIAVAAKAWRTALVAMACAAALGGAGCAPAKKKPTSWPDGSSGGAAAAPAKPIAVTDIVKVRSFEGIDEYVLPNGMKVLLFPDDSVENVTVNITYFVGSLHEGYGETGMAHLLEHMLFKGTKDNREVLSLVQKRGGWLNGTTWNDRTNYYETLPAKDDNLAWALGMEADRMRNATILQSDLDTEFSVVRSEFEMGENNPSAILSERMTSTAYLWHNYGKSTIGAKSDIEKVKSDRLRAFYDTYYQPDNAMLMVSGKFDGKEALTHIAATFGSIPARRAPCRRPIRRSPCKTASGTWCCAAPATSRSRACSIMWWPARIPTLPRSRRSPACLRVSRAGAFIRRWCRPSWPARCRQAPGAFAIRRSSASSPRRAWQLMAQRFWPR